MQENIRSWLNKRGVSDEVIALFNIYTTDHAVMGEDTIVIPVCHPDGSFAFNKYRHNPFAEHPDLPKYTYDKGGRTALFALHHVQPGRPVVITEGELDCLVLWSMNIQAVSSTGGAQSFQEEWGSQFGTEQVYVCYDNDEAGAVGMVRTLTAIPHAKVVFIPEQPGVKDITDFVARGGDFHALLHTAYMPQSLEEVHTERVKRLSQWLPVRFHDAYIKANTPKPVRERTPYKGDDTKVARAKAYPCDSIIEFRRNKARCPVHNEKTPSLHYYRKTNSCHCFGCRQSFDSIGLYCAVHGCDFKEAVNKLSGL